MEKLDRYREHVLGLYRIVVGLLFACHGAATLFNVLGGPQGGQVPGVGQWPAWWAAAIQLVGGGLVMLGVGTRVAALLCSGSMAYAYFVKHQTEAFFPIQNGGEAAAMFCWAFLLVAALGPGAWAMGSLFARADRAGRGEGVRVTAA
ncbi:DoxX family membrane protein [Streptomyces verrucosisporus]|uniref:DoxX family protein n=1 Tax=Streptomyces verrucosisporus TaxID=1695161 RepID=UPI0019D31261|nr:DoxX family membrane protein [Streptomyces verrucosisporus]MBN3929517.1 DoxX family membrane protein [Streptomyces verrucosisporus]